VEEEVFVKVPNPLPPGAGRDTWLAAVVSAGLVLGVLVVGALAAPLFRSEYWPATHTPDEARVVRLSEPAVVVPAPVQRARPEPRRRARGVAVERRRVERSERRARRGRARVRVRVRSGGAVAGGLPRATLADADADGMPDRWERTFSLDPDKRADASDDADGDGLDNLTEFRTASKPTLVDSNRDGVSDSDDDTDGDGLSNALEVRAGLKPWAADSDADGRDDGRDDTDGDGLDNAVEQLVASDLTDPDSNSDGRPDAVDDADGDGVSNLVEQEAGTDPAGGGSAPPAATPTPDGTPTVLPAVPTVDG